MKASSAGVKLQAGCRLPVLVAGNLEVGLLPGAFPLGPFIVEASGKLIFRAPDRAAGFSFAWRGHRFTAALEEGSVSLTGALGKVPSSAAGPAKREVALALLRTLPRALPGAWALRLTADHRIQIEATEKMAWPANATDLIVPLVRFLLRLAPYLDLLEEAELRPSG